MISALLYFWKCIFLIQLFFFFYWKKHHLLAFLWTSHAVNMTSITVILRQSWKIPRHRWTFFRPIPKVVFGRRQFMSHWIQAFCMLMEWYPHLCSPHSLLQARGISDVKCFTVPSDPSQSKISHGVWLSEMNLAWKLTLIGGVWFDPNWVCHQL